MKTKKVIVLPYEAQWKRDFEIIRAELSAAIGECAVSIEHVGSTSVPGLSAKPVIDIDIVIENEAALPEAIGRLERIGYRHEGDLGICGREAFEYAGKEHLKKHHLYVCARDSEEIKRHIAFRDYLRAHCEAAEEYGRIKEEGARLYPENVDGYIRHKSAFIERIYKECGLFRLDVRELKTDELDEAADFSWKMCADRKTRSYPIFANREEIFERYKKSMDDKAGGVLICRSGGVMRGAVCWFSIPEDRYVQTTGLYAEESDAAAVLMEEIEKRHCGYEAYIGITKENETVAEALEGRGYSLLDDSYDMRLRIVDMKKAQDAGHAFRVNEKSISEYIEYHRKHFDGGYWNAERIGEDFANWDIYAASNGAELAGALFAKDYGNGEAEVFGMESEDEQTAYSIMAYALADMKRRHEGIKEVVFMAEAENEGLLRAAIRVGFEETNRYCCWYKKIGE